MEEFPMHRIPADRDRARPGRERDLRQRGPAPDPLVRENATVKLAAHTYVIPDANVGLVPNVGIHVTAIFAMAFFRMPWPASGA
jgi:hypothetical protein